MGDGDDIQRSSSKKRKSKKTAETAPEETNEPKDERPSRTKKSRKKDADYTAAVDAPIPPEPVVEGVTDGEEKPSTKEKKKRKKNKDSVAEEEVVQPVDDTETPLDEDTTSKPKKKKSKKRDPSPSHETDAIEEPVKKKRKRSKPDPSEDEALSEQARKALIYAHSYVRYPDSWKFNKARQNWLIRNVWSDELIPETYFPMSMKYLSSVQGGIREALIQACKTLLTGETGAEANEEATDTPKDDAATNGEQTSDVKRTRAQLLLDTLQVES